MATQKNGFTVRGGIQLRATDRQCVAEPEPMPTWDEYFRVVRFDNDEFLFTRVDLQVMLRAITRELGLWENDPEIHEWVNPLIHTDELTRDDARKFLREDMVERSSRPPHSQG
jgi:hypothetical protein